MNVSPAMQRYAAEIYRLQHDHQQLTLESVNYARRQFGIARFNCQSATDLRYIAWRTNFACRQLGGSTQSLLVALGFGGLKSCLSS
jgi:hypothetical protein